MFSGQAAIIQTLHAIWEKLWMTSTSGSDNKA
jgi:hypothetical protein